MEKFQRIAAILPIGKLFDRIFDEGIAPAIKELGAELIRIPPEFSKVHSIHSADSVIADVTARNPHVLYLAGFAHALNKPIIYITQHGEDFPPGLSVAAPIIYGSDPNFLRAELIAHFSGQPPHQSSDDPRTKFLSIFGDLLQKHGYQHRGQIILDPPNTYTLLEQDMDLPLVQDIARRARELGLRVKLM